MLSGTLGGQTISTQSHSAGNSLAKGSRVACQLITAYN
jgi:hypothetical protein